MRIKGESGFLNFSALNMFSLRFLNRKKYQYLGLTLFHGYLILRKF